MSDEEYINDLRRRLMTERHKREGLQKKVDQWVALCGHELSFLAGMYDDLRARVRVLEEAEKARREDAELMAKRVGGLEITTEVLATGTVEPPNDVYFTQEMVDGAKETNQSLQETIGKVIHDKDRRLNDAVEGVLMDMIRKGMEEMDRPLLFEQFKNKPVSNVAKPGDPVDPPKKWLPGREKEMRDRAKTIFRAIADCDHGPAIEDAITDWLRDFG